MVIKNCLVCNRDTKKEIIKNKDNLFAVRCCNCNRVGSFELSERKAKLSWNRLSKYKLKEINFKGVKYV